MSENPVIPSILVVEDQEHIREAMMLILKIEGYRVFGGSNGKNGLAMAQEIKPDLILCDVTMPLMDGFQMAEAIRADPTLSQTPFVFITARTDDKNVNRAKELNIKHYISKPVWPPDLLRIVWDYVPEMKVKRTLTEVTREMSQAQSKSKLNVNS